MKKFAKILFVTAMLAIATPVSTFATGTEPTANEARAKQLNDRLLEIKEMDMAKLSKDQKRVLRKEVKQIKKELKAISGGVYLSIGAIIIIILLLILLL